ncbi:hypothetical protein BegalDRAFT_3452 [Beggiatoa alba B18LD]|uniref:Ancillary SecYEG translocon subunit/Cell division coordinator CpoB TPR domain-containing protein n=1 Tax=Beggiatoa alba B18LD TaxID=395493 RepID=I3CKX3_9GAMM|nr:tetratricopeptide repeat protein [Beggiatoa alba]EIJ44266.1 hypothetical protein BegalDRAFT_3452 [Beggiatoa alba B18LD]
MEYQTENEQVEAIKQWFKENGSSILIGVAIGFGLLFGWRAWESYVAQTAEMSSMTYEQLVEAVEKKQLDSSRETLTRLQKEHGDSLYAVLGAFQLAAEEVEANNFATAHEQLAWVLNQPAFPAFVHIARLRNAKLYLAENNIAEAKKLIDGVKVGEFAPAYAELRGDIASLEGQLEAAKTAYTQALESKELSSNVRQYIQIKLDNLGLSSAQVVAAAIPTLPEPPKPEPVQSDLGNPSTQKATVIDAVAHPNTATSQETTITIPAVQTSTTETTITPITREEVKLPAKIVAQPPATTHDLSNPNTSTAQKRPTTPISNDNIYSTTIGDNEDDTPVTTQPEPAPTTPKQE